LRLVNKTDWFHSREEMLVTIGRGYVLAPLLWTIVYAEAVNHQSRAPP